MSKSRQEKLERFYRAVKALDDNIGLQGPAWAAMCRERDEAKAALVKEDILFDWMKED